MGRRNLGHIPLALATIIACMCEMSRRQLQTRWLMRVELDVSKSSRKHAVSAIYSISL